MVSSQEMGRTLGNQAERAREKGGAGLLDMVGVLDATRMAQGPGYHKKVVNDDIKVRNREREILRYYYIYI